MNTRPTATARPHDANLIHASTCTTLSVNTEGERPRTTFRVTKCEIRKIGDDVAVRFSGHAVDVTPRPRAGLSR